MMVYLCEICGERMYVGEAFRINTDRGTLVGYVHRKCLNHKQMANEEPKDQEYEFNEYDAAGNINALKKIRTIINKGIYDKILNDINSVLQEEGF